MVPHEKSLIFNCEMLNKNPIAPLQSVVLERQYSSVGITGPGFNSQAIY